MLAGHALRFRWIRLAPAAVLLIGSMLVACSDDTVNKPDQGRSDAGADSAPAFDGLRSEGLSKPDGSAAGDLGEKDAIGAACVPACGYGYTCTKGTCLKNPSKQDHASIMPGYLGAKTCLACHPTAMDELMSSNHYKFHGTIPANYVYDKTGQPVSQKYSGKLWKLCGFPSAYAASNWLGKLKDDPATPHIDTPGGCARCHIGIGLKPFTAAGAAAPSAEEKGAANVDCLVCHAKNYERKFYVSQKNGAPELNPKGQPIVFAVPRVDGEFDYSGLLAAAQSVGPTSGETCGRCHFKAGGGAAKFGNTLYSLKRGVGYSPESDVHAAKGMSCSTCHYAGAHKMIRAVNNDLTIYDKVRPESGCIECHGKAPHQNTGDLAELNKHQDKIACVTCHVTSKGGGTYKDFSKVVCASGTCSSPTSMETFDVQMTKFPADFKITYSWFNGKVQKPIHPMGSKSDGKIFPFKVAAFNQAVDAQGNLIPLAWGPIYGQGNLTAGFSTGITLYAELLASLIAAGGVAADYGLPAAAPGPQDHFVAGEDVFSLSHGITRDKALQCADCHSTASSVLDWSKLGLTNPNPM